MKRTILVIGIFISIFTVTSCLDNDDMAFIPEITETNNSSHYSKDGEEGNDSIPSDSTGTVRPPTGGETGQTPVKP